MVTVSGNPNFIYPTNPTTKYRCEFVNLNCIFAKFCMWPSQFGRKLVLVTRCKWLRLRPRHQPPKTETIMQPLDCLAAIVAVLAALAMLTAETWQSIHMARRVHSRWFGYQPPFSLFCRTSAIAELRCKRRNDMAPGSCNVQLSSMFWLYA